MSNFLEEIVQETGNPAASIASDGVISDVAEWIDTGSYTFNAVLSGSIYGGIASNKVLGLCGEQGTGKSFYSLSIAKNFQKLREDNIVIIFESEQAITSEMLENYGFDLNRVSMIPVDTVEKFRHQAYKTLEKYESKYSGNNDAPRMLFILDSLGMLSTEKEIGDIKEGNDTRDMTRAQLVKGAFRALTMKSGMLNVPIIFTNHVYDDMGGMGKEIGGGSGLKYAASNIAMLTKSKEKDGQEVTGAVIKSRMYKSRFTREQRMIPTRLRFDSGLDRYYGLLDLAEKYGIFKKIGNRYEVKDGTKQYGKKILNYPEKYFTQEVLDQLDSAAHKEFLFGSDLEPEDLEEIGETDESIKEEESPNEQ